MGKGEITSGGEKGLYQVWLTYEKARIDTLKGKLQEDIDNIDTIIGQYEEELSVIESEVSYYEAQAATYSGDDNRADQYREALTNVTKKTAQYLIKKSEIGAAELAKVAAEKKIEYLNTHVPADPSLTDVWCADLTENLTGTVGTIEVPGERGTVLIQPGYAAEGVASAAIYSAARDGQLQPAVAGTPAGVFFNLSMLPGWQKWKPTYRFGTITFKGTGENADKCDVDLDAATSSQQDIDVNQVMTLTNVPIEYMNCNGSAFSVGDAVLVKFENQDINQPKVIGFKDNPKPCDEFVVFTVAINLLPNADGFGTQVAIVYNAFTETILFNCVAIDDPDYVAWRAAHTEIGLSLFDTQTLCGRPSGQRDVFGNVIGPGGLPAGDVTVQPSYMPNLESQGLVDTGTSVILQDWQSADLRHFIKEMIGNHDYQAATYDFSNGITTLFPQSHVLRITLPDAPVGWCSGRNRERYERYFYAKGDDDEGLEDWHVTQTTRETRIYNFIGPAGEIPGEHQFDMEERTTNVSGTSATKTDRRIIGNIPSIPDSRWSDKKMAIYGLYRRWNSGFLSGQYAEKTSAFCMCYVYSGVTFHQNFVYDQGITPQQQRDDNILNIHADLYTELPGPSDYWWTHDEAITVLVQSQVIYNKDGIAGTDITTGGTNNTLNSAIENAIRYVYSINGVPPGEVRYTGVGVTIMR